MGSNIELMLNKGFIAANYVTALRGTISCYR
jgi:hypothetical protein